MKVLVRIHTRYGLVSRSSLPRESCGKTLGPISHSAETTFSLFPRCRNRTIRIAFSTFSFSFISFLISSKQFHFLGDLAGFNPAIHIGLFIILCYLKISLHIKKKCSPQNPLEFNIYVLYLNSP